MLPGGDAMRFADLEIDGLRAFVAVIDEGGFTAAGQKLGRSQPAISDKIRRLEEALGKRILSRTSRSLGLTEDGELLLGYARQLLALNDETVRRVSVPKPEGVFRLGGAEYFLPQHLPDVLRQFATLYPRAQVEVTIGTTEHLLEQLKSGRLDLVLARQLEGGAGGRVFWSEPLRWVCAPDFEMELGEPLPFCAMPPPCSFRAAALAALQAQNRPWRIVYSSDSILGVQAAVMAGLGVAMLSHSAMQPGLRILDERDGMPAVGEIEVAAYGEAQRTRKFSQPLIELLLARLRSTRKEVRPPAKRRAAKRR